MASSGVKVSDDAFEGYNQMKMKKLHRYMFMSIDKEIGLIVPKCMVKKGEDQKADFDEMMKALPTTEPLYILLDVTCVNKKSKADKDTLLLITWCPDDGCTKDKMLYASSKGSLQTKMNQGVTAIQINDLADFDYEALLEKGAS